jgi:hypothetical protein
MVGEFVAAGGVRGFKGREQATTRLNAIRNTITRKHSFKLASF